MSSVDKKKMSLFYDSFNIATKLAKLIDKSAITNSDNFFPKRTDSHGLASVERPHKLGQGFPILI